MSNYGGGAFKRKLEEFQSEVAQEKSKLKSWKVSFYRSEGFNSIIRRVKSMHERGVLLHPKITKLIEILKDHFQRANAAGKPTRAIVFTQWRNSVAEIVSALEYSDDTNIIKPSAFVGQGKGGGAQSSMYNGESVPVSISGQSQKQQKRAIADFKSGIFNVLVATSIAEEGLDVGYVDLIVSYGM